MELKVTRRNGSIFTITFDPIDSILILSKRWSVTKKKQSWYAQTMGRMNGKQYTIWLHRLILGNPTSQVDHINGNGLDCRRNNLRLVTNQQNSWNRRKRINTRSKFKGIEYRPQTNKWRAVIQSKLITSEKKRGRIISPFFRTEEQAARAYDLMAKELYGQYARLNFPD